MMTISDIANKVEGRIVCSEEKSKEDVEYAFSSRPMNDVLKVERENILLITGLADLQAIRTSEMPEINCIVSARGKKINNEILKRYCRF